MCRERPISGGCARRLLKAAKADYVLAEPKPSVLVDTVGDGNVTVALRASVRSPDWWTARSDLQERVKADVDAATAADAFAPAQ